MTRSRFVASLVASVAAAAAALALLGAGCECTRSTELLPCDSANDCPAGQVCGLVSGTCVDPYPCTTSLGCGPGSFCDPATSTCVPNPPGGPCGSDEDCPSGETCDLATGFCTGTAPPPLAGLVSLAVDPPAATLVVVAGGAVVTQPFTATGTFDDGTTRGWLADGDTVTLGGGWADGGTTGRLAEVTGTVVPAKEVR